MNKLDIFSQNLRRECARFESIAAVCRSANINRQQFSKYLAGQSLPSAVVLRKLCATLNVQEKVLFAEPLQYEKDQKSQSLLALQLLTNDCGGATSDFDFTANSFPIGNFYCYFLLEHVPGIVVRSFIQTKRIGGCTNFTRISILPSGRDRSAHMAKGRHKGIVLENSAEFYFLGINRYPPNQLSFMSIERKIGTHDKHFTGLAVTRSGNASMAVKFCLIPISPKLSIREVIQTLGFVHQSELNTESYVLASLLN